MNLLIMISFILSALLGILRGLDLLFWTDPVSGMCVAGSVWLRYAGLAAAVLTAIVAGRSSSWDGEELRTQRTSAGAAAWLAALGFGLAGVTRLLLGMTGIAALVRALLELFCAVWMGLLARNWLRKGPWHRPTRSLVPAVLGSVLFYWCVLSRFMENSSSWHRVAPTAAVWQMLAALVFLASLARSLYLPGTTDDRTLCAAALTAFALCLCWELPQLVLGGTAELPEILAGAGLCFVGALGGVCAFYLTRNTVWKPGRKNGRHSVG